MAAAGIEKHTANGKLDFHACRVAYINLVLDSGVSLKEAQSLARHATLEMTMNVYGRVREDPALRCRRKGRRKHNSVAEVCTRRVPARSLRSVVDALQPPIIREKTLHQARLFSFWIE